jgi:hypothetical protein
MTKAEMELVLELTKKFRKRLMSISWFSRIFYDLQPCKSPFGPPTAFKFDPIKFSGKPCWMREPY